MEQPHKRILVVSQHYWPENFRITDICRGFAESGVEVDVLCGLPNYPKGEWFEGYCYAGPRRQQHEGAQLFRAGEVPRRGNTAVRIFLNYVSWPVFALFSLPRLHGRRYDAVFCYETSPVLMMLPAIVYAKLHRVPLCTYVLDLWPENLYSVLPVKSRALRAAAAGVSHWLYRRSDTLVAMSGALGEKLRAIAPLMATRVSLRPLRRGARWPWCRSTVKTFTLRMCATKPLPRALPGASAWCLRATSAPRRTLGCLSPVQSALPQRAAGTSTSALWATA